jgi:hypothetical protein
MITKKFLELIGLLNSYKINFCFDTRPDVTYSFTWLSIICDCQKDHEIVKFLKKNKLEFDIYSSSIQILLKNSFISK